MMTRKQTAVLMATVCFALIATARATGPARAPQPARRKDVTAILGAMHSEVAPILRLMTDKQTHKHLGVTFTAGTLNGRSVVLARTGVGKVNAAMVSTLLLENFGPSEVIFTGIAGCLNPKMHPGDVVIGQKLIQHDYGSVTAGGMRTSAARSPVDGRRNPVFFSCDARLVALAQRVAGKLTLDKIDTPAGPRQPRIQTGVIATGDVFVASRAKRTSLRKRHNADAVEMEGAAVAQICHQQKVPFLVIRGLSDDADETADQDLRKNVQAASANAVKLTTSVIAELARGFTQKSVKLCKGRGGGGEVNGGGGELWQLVAATGKSRGNRSADARRV